MTVNVCAMLTVSNKGITNAMFLYQQSVSKFVCWSFPVSTLTREKKMSVQYLSHKDQWLQEGLQLRSNTFQYIYGTGQFGD